jgi:hypothetical protein
MAIEFCDDDEGYIQWVEANAHGYVLNTFRKPAAHYLILHRATCGTITGIPARGAEWTRDYIKICSTDRADLDRWAMDITGGTPTPCQLCKA